MPIEDERQVVLDWKNGSEKAFEALVRNYMGEAFYVAYGFVGNVEDARDLSQDAFIKAYRARDRFDPARPFFPWLYRILRNHCINFVRRSARKHVPLHYDDNPDRERFASAGPTPAEAVEREERARLLRAALGSLSDDHREIIVLKHFKECSYKEIAETLEIPIGTVMSRLYYARRALKEAIERLEDQELAEPAPPLPHGHAAGEVV